MKKRIVIDVSLISTDFPGPPRNLENIKSPKNIPILDGMRAYAVLMVCVAHFFTINEVGLYEANKYLGVFMLKTSLLGLRGVEFFFILSGFLITRILLDSKKSPRYFKTFYLRRMIRIFPLYYTVLAISFFVLPCFVNIDKTGQELLSNQWLLWTFATSAAHLYGVDFDAPNFPSFGHFWSLSVEEIFYLFWPFIIYFSPQKILPKIMWTFILISLVSVLAVVFFDKVPSILRWTMTSRIGVLSLGGLIAYYISIPEKFEYVIKISKSMLAPTGMLLFLSAFIPREYECGRWIAFILSIPFFASIMVIAIQGNIILDIIFKRKVLYFVGKISYGIYVFHGLFLPYFSKYLYNNFLLTLNFNGIAINCLYVAIGLSISVFVAWISWCILESPILKLKKYFVYS